MSGLNVVALISGGKDSLFSILHCQANGHNVVALANLHPSAQDHAEPVEDLESYMYQTIGHAVVPLYEQALGLPLYRQAIIGTAVNKDKSYSPASADNEDDETESMCALLKKVMQAERHVNAVSTGAILSDYQRTRVESVALRLGLVPLSYLWHWPSLPPYTQESLLEDMAAVGQDARTIKVASGGLDESFLWQNVAEGRTISRLSKAARRFGAASDGAVLGEGGEYETLAVAGPSPLWKARIDVSPKNVQTLMGDAGSASVRIVTPSLAPLRPNTLSSCNLRMPPLFDLQFAKLRAKLLQGEDQQSEDCFESPQFSITPLERSEADLLNLDDISGVGDTVAQQTISTMDSIISHLSAAGHGVHDIAYSIIVLRDMSDFAAFNKAYGSYFVRPNPPSRVTIACADALPVGALLSISVTSTLGPREGLHVQSRSYWAPANIGPYSQAIKFSASHSAAAAQASVFIAGQIPLTPATMELPDDFSPWPRDNFVEQASLALQHLYRIGCATGVRQWVFGIAFITSSAPDDRLDGRRAKIVADAWRAWHLSSRIEDAHPDEDDDFDVWDQKHGPGSVSWRGRNGHDDGERVEVGETDLPPLVVIQVDGLPREADVEWIGFGKATGGGRHSSSSIPSHLYSLVRNLRHRIVLAG